MCSITNVLTVLCYVVSTVTIVIRDLPIVTMIVAIV